VRWSVVAAGCFDLFNGIDVADAMALQLLEPTTTVHAIFMSDVWADARVEEKAGSCGPRTSPTRTIRTVMA
jgi:hypothetical protein